MLSTSRFALAAIVVIGTSCGTEEKDFSGSLGACTLTTAIGESSMVICTEYTYTAKADKDPSADAKAEVESSCAESSGTFSTTACSATGMIATCAINSASSKATVTGKMFFGGALMSEELAQQSCTTNSGTYAKL